jgi:hypothetical protein
MNNNDKFQFLNQRILPHRLTVVEAGWLLGFTPVDLTILAGCNMITPMGKPSQNSTKYFATVQIEALRDNVEWLDKATCLLNQYWREKNAGRKKGEV